MMNILRFDSPHFSSRFFTYAAGTVLASALSMSSAVLAEEGRTGGSAAAYLDQARNLQSKIVTFDSHVDIPYGFAGKEHPGDSDPASQFDLTKAKEGEVERSFSGDFCAAATDIGGDPGEGEGGCGEQVREHCAACEAVSGASRDCLHSCGCTPHRGCGKVRHCAEHPEHVSAG